MITCWASIRTTARRWGDSHLQDIPPEPADPLEDERRVFLHGFPPRFQWSITDETKHSNDDVQDAHGSLIVYGRSPPNLEGSSGSAGPGKQSIQGAPRGVNIAERRWGDSHLQDDTPMWSSGLTPASQAGKAGPIPVIGSTLAGEERCDTPPGLQTLRSHPCEIPARKGRKTRRINIWTKSLSTGLHIFAKTP